MAVVKQFCRNVEDEVGIAMYFDIIRVHAIAITMRRLVFSRDYM